MGSNMYDVVIIGGGPAGLTAAIYLARARCRVLVLEKTLFGGQIVITDEVANYPGVKTTSGTALTDTMQRQAEAFGADLLQAEATGLELAGDVKTVHTGCGDFRCFGVLLAMGARPRKAGFQGEDAFRGHGVAYCATCDGEFFAGKDVFVIGGGYAAAEESVFLTRYARHVTILMKTEDFTCAGAVAEPARRHERITVIPRSELVEVRGAQTLTSARWRNLETGEETEYHSRDGENFGVFVFEGYEPDTELVKELLPLTEQGYVQTGESLETSIPGVYAAGDVRSKPLRQVVTATGDGALAATGLEKHVAVMRRKTGIHPEGSTQDEKEKQEESALFEPEMRQQLASVFSRMERPLQLQLYLDHREVSEELRAFMTELAGMTDKLQLREMPGDAGMAPPCVRICHEDGTPTGLAFHGVPGGHEFTSFVLGLCNAAGPGQPLAEETRSAIMAIRGPLRMMVLVTLSCTMCPELVTAAQHIAALNPQVSAEVYDVRHFEQLRERYRVMSVPCLVTDDDRVAFGRKNLQQLTEYLLQGAKERKEEET